MFVNDFHEYLSPAYEVAAPFNFCRQLSSVVEHALRKREVVDSIPTVGCNYIEHSEPKEIAFSSESFSH